MRVCFILKVRREMLAEYKRRHASVWPDMLEALKDTGWHNYSLFLTPDGLLVGYLETDNFAKACEGMKRTAVNAKWQVEMSHFFEAMDGSTPDDSMRPLEEIFHLD
jgi:L-rhamnose mutarotase